MSASGPSAIPMTFTGRLGSTSAASACTSASRPMVSSSSSLPSVTMTTLVTAVGSKSARAARTAANVVSYSPVPPGARRPGIESSCSPRTSRCVRPPASVARARVGTSSTQSVSPSSRRAKAHSPMAELSGNSARALLAASRASVARVPPPTGAFIDVETSKTASRRDGLARLDSRANRPCTSAGSSGSFSGAASWMPVSSPAPGGASPSVPRKPASRNAVCARSDVSARTTASAAVRSRPDRSPTRSTG